MTVTHDLQAGQFVDANGIATHFHEAGTGQPVLFLHGSGPGVSGWANWRHALPPLAESLHVLAPDIVGFGLTERPPRSGTRFVHGPTTSGASWTPSATTASRSSATRWAVASPCR